MSVRIPAGMMLLDERDAFRLASLANRGLRDVRRDALAIDDGLLDLISDLEATAAPYAERVRAATGSAAGTNGIPQGDHSDREDPDMTVREAAELIGCSERYIRRQAKGMFLGRKNRGQWLVDRGAVIERAARRQSA